MPLTCLPLATLRRRPGSKRGLTTWPAATCELGDRATGEAGVQDGGDGWTLDLGIQEDAFFHYAKLAYGLSFNPFDDAIVAFETYLEQFPSSPRRDEAYRFLLRAQVHMTSRDYERALAALGNITSPDETVLALVTQVARVQSAPWNCSKTTNGPAALTLP